MRFSATGWFWPARPRRWKPPWTVASTRAARALEASGRYKAALQAAGSQAVATAYTDLTALKKDPKTQPWVTTPNAGRPGREGTASGRGLRSGWGRRD